MSKMEDFTTISYGENFLTVVVKRSILDVFGSPEYNSVGIKPFHAAGLFLYPLKTSENQRFSDVQEV